MCIYLTVSESGAELWKGGTITVKYCIFRIEVWTGERGSYGGVFGISLKKNGVTKVGAVKNVFIL